MANGELTAKQQRFVEEYLIDLNATAAYLRAGYKDGSGAEVSACQLLRIPKVADAVEKAKAARSERTQVTQDMVINELVKLGFSNMLDYVAVDRQGFAYTDLSQLTREQAAAIQEITVDEYTEGRGEDAHDVKKVKIKLADKRQTLVDIGKHLGMFVERKDVTSGGKPVEAPSVVFYLPKPEE